MASKLRDLIRYHRFLQMVLILGIGGSFHAGFQISMMTFTSVHVKVLVNSTWLERSGLPAHPDSITLLWSLIVSVSNLGACIGSLISGPLIVKYGKKKCLLGSNTVMLISALLMGFSKMGRSFEMTLGGRFLTGLGTGLCMPLHIQYLGEISPKHLRGFANSTASVFLSSGKVLGQILGQRELLGNDKHWPLLISFTGITASVQLLTLPFFPESPPHLLLREQDEQRCLKAMKTLWGPGSHQAELNDLRKQQSALQRMPAQSVLELMMEPSVRWQLCILVITIVTTQLNGIQAIYFYAFEVLQKAGFSDQLIPNVALGLSLCELLSAIFCSVIIERLGRRLLLWGGCGLMGTTLAAITVTLSLQSQFSWMSYCTVSLIFFFVLCFGIGPAGASTSIRMEIFDQSSRSSAFVIGGVLQGTGSFVVAMTFPFIMERLQQFCFTIFMGVLYVAAVLFYFFLPETKKKSILEIREDFDKLNFKKKQGVNVSKDSAVCTSL